MIGETVSHYRIDEQIGSGGMGVVYRAEDLTLGRKVAVKFLSADLIENPSARKRFVREAQSASALNHRNICAVYEIGEEAGAPFIVMEYVTGKSLDRLIAESALPISKALTYAAEIADALAKAHSMGIVHRDLKPSNIMVTEEGSVKLLDFGLALRTGPDVNGSGTVTLLGQIVGTPAYMSPEQVRGEALDHRSDIFSFGAVLYRMVTGRDAFDRGSAIETMNAILNSEPAEISVDSSTVPFAIESVIRHCLEKSPDDRFQTARDLGYALEASSTPVPVARSRTRSNWLRRNAAWGGIVLAAVAVALLVADLFSRRTIQPSIDGKMFAQITADAGAELFPSLSGDGKAVVYASKHSGSWNIHRRDLGSAESVNLTRDSNEDDTQPAFSPDRRQIAFRSERNGGGIFVMAGDGSGVRQLTDAGFNPAWSPDGRQLVFAEEGTSRPEDRSGRTSQLWAVDVASGRRRLVTKGDAVQPQWSPNGRLIAYWAIDLDGNRDLWTIPAQGGQPVRITHDPYLDWNPVWSPDGGWIYFCSNRGGTMGIWRIPIRGSTGEPRGAPEPIRTPAAYPAHLSFSRDGRRLAYVQQLTTGRVCTVRFDPDREKVVSEPKDVLVSAKGASRPSLSPDGQWLSFNTTEQEEHLFTVKTDGSNLRQLTNGQNRNRGPRWSPDGKHLAFFSTSSGDWEIWTVDVEGTGLHQVTDLGGQNVAWPVWSPDGKHLAYSEFGVNTYVMDLTKPWTAQVPDKLPPFTGQKELFNGWAWSPDGDKLAGFLNSDDGVATYSPASRDYRRLTQRGSDPVWLSDSRRLLFLDHGKIHMVDSESGNRHEILSLPSEEIQRRGFCLSPDDRRIYFSVSSTEADVWLIQFER
jgi:Tol biopolymer transport system component/predicted Ser/Thr protein kinase